MPAIQEFETEQALTTADLAAQTNRTAAPHTDDGQRAALFPPQELDQMRSRWQSIQGGFVDDPRVAVKQADELVATAIKRLAEIFAGERSGLEHDWDRGDDVSTEDLRQALRRYRSFFDRLLSV